MNSSNRCFPLLLPALFLLLAPLSGSRAASEVPAVIATEARELTFPLALEALGTARANEAIDLRPQVSEVITAIHFEEGQQVEAGTVLVELADREARADVAGARASLEDLEHQVRRSRELFQTRALAASELDQRIAQRDAARAALEAARARLADAQVRAPFAGRVGLRRVSVGGLVTPSTIITTLDDTDPIKLDFDVPETALAQLEAGLELRARSAAWPDETFRGKISTIDTRVDPVSRSVAVRSLVPNPDGRLRPGMFLNVTLMRESVMALIVPEEALVPEQNRQFVFVVGSGNIVEKREVKTGRRRPGEVEIVDGLRAGERVITEGTQKARPGAPVEIVPGRARSIPKAATP